MSLNYNTQIIAIHPGGKHERTKYCKGCRSYHPLSEFGKSSRTVDGLRSKCYKCEAEYAVDWRDNNPGKQSEYQRRYLSKPQNKRKHDARNKLNRTLKRNPDLYQRPTQCPLCGRTHKVTGHHPDHTRPLYAFYACNRCHHKLARMSAAEVVLTYRMFAPSYKTPEEVFLPSAPAIAA